MKVLITGATGKVGRRLVDSLSADGKSRGMSLRALCHNRRMAGIESVTGTIAERSCVRAAMRDVSHVIHLATCKETPEDVMDVTVKGLFWLLEEFRVSPTAKQFILIGGDAAVGHFFVDHSTPVTERTPHMAYPGCYALSKVLEEVMLSQFVLQYGINACCLRAPWIMEKDDFKYSLSFGDDVFGGPRWQDLVAPEVAERCRKEGTVPLLIDARGQPLKRNFVHVDDLVAAIVKALDHPAARGRTFNISMDEPVDYGEVAAYLNASRGLASIAIPSSYHSNWMDNAAAKFALGWRPRIGLRELIEMAWTYERAADDPRIIWYPG
jgi:nucleoside-diphosphate-sugar epimerase